MGEYRTTQGDTPPLPRHERRARQKRIMLLVILGIACIAAVAYHLRIPRYIPAGGSLLSASYAEVRAPAAGQVLEIRVRSGQSVSRQDLMVQLEDAAERAELNAARRQAAKAEAERDLAIAELAEQQRCHSLSLDAARQTLQHQLERLELIEKLAGQGLASGRDLADQRHAIRLAEIEYARLEAIDPEMDARRLTVLEREIEVRRQAVSQAEARLKARAIQAPIDGKVIRYPFFVGEVVRPDSVLYEIFGGDAWQLRLRVPERFATRVAVGQPYRARLRSVSSLRTRWFHGTVTEVRDAIQADAQQRYRVIYADFDPGADVIPPGATAEARIRIGNAPIWEVLLGL